jgi:hypothetical protein
MDGGGKGAIGGFGEIFGKKIAKSFRKWRRRGVRRDNFTSENGLVEAIRKFLKNLLTAAPVLIGSFSTPKRGEMVQFETSAEPASAKTGASKRAACLGHRPEDRILRLNSEGWTTGGASSDGSRKRRFDGVG